jgi:hypothetical protein
MKTHAIILSLAEKCHCRHYLKDADEGNLIKFLQYTTNVHKYPHLCIRGFLSVQSILFGVLKFKTSLYLMSSFNGQDMIKIVLTFFCFEFSYTW